MRITPFHRARVLTWRALTVALMLAAGFLAASVATTASAQSTLPATDAFRVPSPGPTQVSGAAVPPDTGRDSPTGEAIAALVGRDPAAALARIPAGFTAAMGYRPVLDGGVPENPDGGCSSPIPLPGSFEAPCRTHDLGYDLLRFSARSGVVLGSWAREALDAQLVARVDARCAIGDDGCHTAADLVRAGVRTNSHRQGDGVPVVETPAQIASSTARLLWVPVARAADVLGSPAGRAAAAAALVVTLIGVWRGSGHRSRRTAVPSRTPTLPHLRRPVTPSLPRRHAPPSGA